MAAHVAHLVDLIEELFDVEFFEEPDADAEFEHRADGGGQRAAGDEARAVCREFGAVDPIAEDNAVEQLYVDRNMRPSQPLGGLRYQAVKFGELTWADPHHRSEGRALL